MSEADVGKPSASSDGSDRRTFFSAMAMFSGLLGGYGLFASLAARFLFPAGPAAKEWMFVAEVSAISPGAAFDFRSPAGHIISIAHLGEKAAAEDFVALSRVCPHLGCRVHWESVNNRFFCPCHNGAFDAEGNATEGPPKDARQVLARYPVKVEQGLLFIEVPLATLAQADDTDGAPEAVPYV